MKELKNPIKANEKQHQEYESYISLIKKIDFKNLKEYLGSNTKIEPPQVNEKIVLVSRHLKELMTIQYELSQIPKNVFFDDGVTIPAVNYQADNWIVRLTAILNILTIKQSEFNKKQSIRRDLCIFLISVLASLLITGFFTIKSNKETKEFYEAKHNIIIEKLNCPSDIDK